MAHRLVCTLEVSGILSGADIEQRQGLRCRFVNTSGSAYDVDASYTEDGCSAQCAVETEDCDSKAFVLLDNQDEPIPCKSAPVPTGTFETEPVGQEASASSPANFRSVVGALGWLDRYLFVWIIIVMVLGVVAGNYIPGIETGFNGSKIDSVSLPIAIGLWWMMYPVLCKVRYELLGKQLLEPDLRNQLAISFVLNWLIGPALMTGIAWATLPDLSGYRNGVILVGCARCIAMVLIWNQLACGDTDFCAILVAFNSILQIVLYAPAVLFFLNVVSGGSVSVSFSTVAKSVALFLGLPLAAGFLTRLVLRKWRGAQWYDRKFLPWFGPTALIGLLYTIFVMFALQGKQIVHNLGDVARVAVPLLVYFAITFWGTLAVCCALKISYPKSITQTFTASSNNFELAIAVAVASFGINSEEALAAVVGPLIEVPVLLGLVYVALGLKNRLW
ncbi:arsenite transporter [Klebsormidium nitens]|uniref:Arsenite transporter n=1 Tax=Klebsormidium nitens TaxID=105231 RepID=A0A1Y1IN45_KLENI|nr:arsenite transporter [Klebsormidium nitens]|eukprot:GAQ89538.1 arsenite transporter [Klebsormidium nitens]